MRALTDIRALAFDLDNTLWEVEPVLVRAEQRLIEWLRANWPRIPERFSLEEMRAARRQLALDQPERAHDFNYLRTASMARHARDCGYEETVGAEAFEVFFSARNEVDVYQDVRGALERLAKRFSLATLSNGNADLERIGLAELFSVSLNACAVGCAKPDPRSFQALVRALSVPAQEVAYVGDDPYIDIEGARRCGLRAIWMNRQGVTWPETLRPPDVTVADCTELAELLTGTH
jgi:FMN hydrolase / 5-amino-6-(5-phospho-D-ribitylamino)uracil phosphatase